ncbi:MAG: phosphotransferase system enzyme I (PtsP) [Pseudoalteromonas rhizosphaerae]|jgi:phosphotransferase system enzyme I (PtsP)|uniref:phosphoenolpyruvate--protein phosphotransferase n=1 Tax=Pseudoalteromonas neustonica TaxID=1840331 RepID=A0ABY3FA49_9GAMM|nr:MULTISPECIES: phosphoenolpyruvate--protein phosphotransferase [Pseudoalteromonas]MBB1292677.1 phosphoenolpyruvate--protein phosphotransferase [Pseudoalteromonas sp. SR41-4]MBB1300868.1 phosphoenolpyruvate--protein phosphotransferase [Pseudoalteromonas sp. SR44-8]MBB1308798.1 phosphoenolpyruvate--protein phosphotransferase [Pseudoalteromonas sp. SR41-8]MBB1398436.1 phosphoenolpyruvate--protein phosphotransferase [Pseudoalteromonas sp. SG44-8]MBB1408099.1 phosphoenolpyruvate--protein phosphot|tara:strand:+ start:1460 stop:3733 length:2274 start_codon:yes stop_codon:yes gene_type:complete
MLATLRAIAESVSQQASLDSALACFVEMVKDAMKTECCSIYFADYSQDNFVLMATRGLNPAAVGKFRIGFTEGLVGLVAQREEPINIAFAKSHPRFKLSPEVDEEGFNAFLSVPVVHQKKVLGVIVVQQKIARVFSQDEESFLITLSAQLASQLAHAEIKEVLRQDEFSHQTSVLKGVSSAPGIAIGQAFVILPKLDFKSIELKKDDNCIEQRRLFTQAVAATRKEFNTLSMTLSDSIPKEALAVFEVYQQLLDAKSLGQNVEAQLQEGWCAKSALKIVIERLISQFNAMQDPYIKERAVDVKDIGLRVLHHLVNTEHAVKSYPKDTVLIANTLTPAMLAEVPKGHLVGVVSVNGAANSHASILTRAMGIPAIWGIEDLPLLQFDGKPMILDAYAGRLYISPSQMLQDEYLQLQHQESLLNDKFVAEQECDAVTLDGEHISLLLNAGLELNTEKANTKVCDGVGLYRTEAWFMQKGQFPSQIEQENWYREVLASYHPEPVVMRTLDIGGDKALDYFDITEENPFLGWRGIRVTLDHPEIFLDQLKAMVRANIGLGNLKIMLPMISGTEEVDESLALLEQAYFELEEKYPEQAIERPEIGVMLEVPSSVFMLPEWSKKVDFCSVGSNDLTQYLLAVDRSNARVADLFNPYHPAVLRVLQKVAKECQQYEMSFSLCGELGGDPEGAILLIAMGYRRLSMNYSSLSKVKWVLRRLKASDMEALLAECLAQSTAKQVLRLTRNFMIEHQLGELFYTPNQAS